MKIGRALAGGHLPSIAKAIFAHNGVREEVLLKVMDLIKEEVNSLCRKVKENEPPLTFLARSSNRFGEFFFPRLCMSITGEISISLPPDSFYSATK